MDIRGSYREAAVRGASPVELVMRLYEQMVEDLNQALKAIEQNDVEARTNRINHAILIGGHLQSQLDFDNGGAVARDLDHFYDTLRQNLVSVQFHPSTQGLTQQITDLLAVREAWMEVARVETSAVTATPGMLSPATNSEPELVRMDWKG